MEGDPSTGGGGPLCRTPCGEAVIRTDPDTAAHMERTGALAGALAALLGFAPAAVARLRAAAALHDVGKAAVSSRILRKPAALSRAERAEVERHTSIGHRMLLGSSDPDAVLAATIALTHHERFDGGGYPHGLAREEIPIEARIVAVADVLDALLSDRPYRAALPRGDALDHLAVGGGTQFDPDVVACALAGVKTLFG